MSPFKGITDNVTPRMQRLGKFRKGGEKPANSNRPGPELDYWRITANDPAVQKAVDEIYGAKPKSVIVFLPYPETTENFSVDGELWDAGGLVHRCDGTTMSIWREDIRMPNGKIKTVYQRGSKPCSGGHTDDDPKRNLVGRLTFVPAIKNPNSAQDGIFYLPALAMRGFPGAFTMETHSVNDCLNILTTLSGIAATIDREGRPIAFELYRYPQEISTPKWDGTPGRSRAEKHLVGLRVAPEWFVEQFGGQIMALGGGAYRPEFALEAGATTVVNAAALPANVPAPKPAPKAATPKPAPKAAPEPSDSFVNPNERVAELGQALWGTHWPVAMQKLVDNGIGTVPAQLASMETRYHGLTSEVPGSEMLEKHLKSIWPGSNEILIELAAALADAGAEWEPLKIIAAVDKFYVDNTPNNELAAKVIAHLTTII